MLDLAGRPDGAIAAQGRVMGCYLHGLFASDDYRHAFLDRLKRRQASGVVYESTVETTLDRLAAHLEAHLDIDGMLAAAHAFAAREDRPTHDQAKLWRIG
jgi:adenosylcobyric acid synthase